VPLRLIVQIEIAQAVPNPAKDHVRVQARSKALSEPWPILRFHRSSCLTLVHLSVVAFNPAGIDLLDMMRTFEKLPLPTIKHSSLAITSSSVPEFRRLVLLRSVALPEFRAVQAHDASVWQHVNIIFRTVATPAVKAAFPARFHI
jgi:hypothetical protein